MPTPRSFAAEDLPGIVIDDSQAKKVGEWQQSQSVKPYVGAGYAHDQDNSKGEKTATFAPEIPRTGRYEIRLAYTASENRAVAVPVTVFSADGEKLIHVNMRQPPPIDGRFISLGQYRCEAAGQNFVLVANEGTKGHVVIDAVQYLAIDDDAQTAPADVKPAEAALDWRYFGFHTAGKGRATSGCETELESSCKAQPHSDRR